MKEKYIIKELKITREDQSKLQWLFDQGIMQFILPRMGRDSDTRWIGPPEPIFDGGTGSVYLIMALSGLRVPEEIVESEIFSIKTFSIAE